jgi:hypothetical protein
MKTVEVRNGEKYTYVGIDDREKVDRVHGDPELGDFCGGSFDALKKFCVEKNYRVRVIAQV